MILAINGIIASSISGAVPLLLDLYPNAAAAYSVRKLRTAYTGSAIRVRRSSDNTEQNIGFTAGNLDITALTSFCSGTNGFVTTWYDQSGNGINLTQTTAGNQPQIVSSGAILTQNGKPSISFNGSTHNFDCASTTISISDSSLFITYQQTAAAQANILALQSGAAYYFLNYSTQIYYATTLTSIGSSTLGDGLFGLVTINLQVGVTQTFYKNNTLIFTKPTPTAGLQTFNKLCGSAFGNPTPQNHSEIIAYPTNQIANRNAINTNITTYYGL
jgi:Alpha-L-arabinofuranosidase B, catalytic